MAGGWKLVASGWRLLHAKHTPSVFTRQTFSILHLKWVYIKMKFIKSYYFTTKSQSQSSSLSFGHIGHTCKLLVPQPSTVTVPPVMAAPAKK
ncbi:hypothetical protein Hanom_Chr16g01492341 [Helianthus anomalus]